MSKRCNYRHARRSYGQMLRNALMRWMVGRYRGRRHAPSQFLLVCAIAVAVLLRRLQRRRIGPLARLRGFPNDLS